MEQLCDLWKYQYTDASFTTYLKQNIPGYDNGKPYNLLDARNERKKWLEERKFYKEDPLDELTAKKQQYLQRLLHPENAFLGPKKPSYQQPVEPFGSKDILLKNYQNTAKHNLQPNIISFTLFDQGQEKKQRQSKRQTDYVNTFYQKYGEKLVKMSPQFWQTILYNIFQILNRNKDQSNQFIFNQLNVIFPDKDGINYLITFKNQLCTFLQGTKFFEKKIQDLKGQMQDYQPKKKIQKSAKWLTTQDEQKLKQLDFVTMLQKQLTNKIPALRRFDRQQYIQFVLEPPQKADLTHVQRIRVKQVIDPIYQKCFESQQLNPIQSIVYEHAVKSSENMLVCAPTGSGKTNIATLSILWAIGHVKDPLDVRIVYISPMKALANELVQKFSAKLPFLKTKESSGDIQLSQKQMATTNILITTPQKFDVTTRKGTSALEKVHLIILDEVHLLNDQRGWVLESIVARLFRTIERTQRHIRLVGLSATLPNYYDVADFLHVDKGLFHFDATFRPVPLLIHFVGIKNPKDCTNTLNPKKNMKLMYDQKCYDIVLKHLKNNKQVLVFVHSRKQTVQYCKFMMKRSEQMNDQHLFRPTQNCLKKYPNIRDKNIGKLVNFGVGFHHAGMIRSDRNVIQKMFLNGNIKVLLATATLAWGVNLPAYAVIIKGTQIYDPSGNRDLSILDVQQMFGRAGRPQYDVTGEATLMSDHAKVNFYMGALTNSSPIDSRFLMFIKEALNAEITSGTVTSEDEAFDWLKYTFLAVRLKKCPQVYGCPRGSNEAQRQMYYDTFLRERIISVLYQLDQMKLIRLDRRNSTVTSTQLGRITSHYYIKCDTMAHFCTTLNIYSNERQQQNRFNYKTDLQLLTILSQCKQFEVISPRPEQKQQLENLMHYWILDERPDFTCKKDQYSKNVDESVPLIGTSEKVLLLLQGYLRDVTYDTFSLVNDTNYVVQNGIRLLRCMLDLCSKKNQAENVRIILNWCKYIQNRVFKEDSPLIQFTKFSYTGCNAMRMKKQISGFLSENHYKEFVKSGMSIDQYLQIQDEVQKAVRLKVRDNKFLIRELQHYCSYVPRIDVSYMVKPIAQTILKIDLQLFPRWVFNPKWHLKSQIFWILFDDSQQLLHSQTISIDEQFVNRKSVKASFYVPYKGVNDYRLLVTSDRWMTDCESQTHFSLQKLGLQIQSVPFTQLLALQPLPVTALKNPVFESLYKYFRFFNPIQTQIFFPLYQTNKNVLIGAPTGSGKTIMSELAILNLFKTTPQKKVVYVAPLKSLVRQRLKDWAPRFKAIKKSVVELSGDFTPDIESLNKADIIVTTPEKWDGITRSQQRQYTKQVGLVIFDQIHLLGQERGAVLEVIVSRMNKSTDRVRMIGLSTAMSNGNDVAEWFGAEYFFNFRPTVRPVPIQIHFQGFSQKHYCPRMGTMNKPAFNHIKKHSDGKPVIIFVSSRRQTRLTANDLIAYSQMYHKSTCPYVLCSPNIIQHAISKLHDDYLKQTLSFGIVMHHAGLDHNDRQICEELFVKNRVQIMIATSTLAWGVNFPARLVIIKGTEYFDAKSHKYVDMQATDLLQMIGRAGRPQFDDKGVAFVYCESSKKDFFRKFLNDPFPIESSLLEQIADHINAEVTRGQITNTEQCIEWITWSFMFRRILKNPTFYGLDSQSSDTIKLFLQNLVLDTFHKLAQSRCIDIYSNQQTTEVMPTPLGFIAATYYLKHQTIAKYNSEIRPSMAFNELMKMLSDAEEFKETPLRHNQDVHNKQLSDMAPFAIKNYGSPQQKTFLLLQMHMFNLPYPIRDYLNDAKLILDSCSRVILGLIGVAIEKKYFDTVRMGIYLQQALYQGLGCNIPFITYDVWNKMNKQFNGLAGIVQNRHKLKSSFQTFLKQNVIQYDANKKQQIQKALNSLPKIKIKTKSVYFDTQNNVQGTQYIKEGGQAIIYVDLQKQNLGSNRVIMQKSTKTKDVVWWVLIADAENTLLAIKKVSVKRKLNVKIQIQVPENLRRNSVAVYLMADSYIGLDQMCPVNFQLQ